MRLIAEDTDGKELSEEDQISALCYAALMCIAWKEGKLSEEQFCKCLYIDSSNLPELHAEFVSRGVALAKAITENRNESLSG